VIPSSSLGIEGYIPATRERLQTGLTVCTQDQGKTEGGSASKGYATIGTFINAVAALFAIHDMRNLRLHVKLLIDPIWAYLDAGPTAVAAFLINYRRYCNPLAEFSGIIRRVHMNTGLVTYCRQLSGYFGLGRTISHIDK